jgi:hypothetical protein
METFVPNLPPKISGVVTQRMNSAIQNTENMDQVENRLNNDNILAGSAGQTDLVGSIVKTCTTNPDGTMRQHMEVKVNRTDQSHLIE